MLHLPVLRLYSRGPDVQGRLGCFFFFFFFLSLVVIHHHVLLVRVGFEASGIE